MNGETTMSGNVAASEVNGAGKTNEITFCVGRNAVTMREEDGNLIFLSNCSLDDAAKTFLQAVSAMAREQGYHFGKGLSQ